MINNEDIKKSLEVCAKDEDCAICSYHGEWDCTEKLKYDALSLIVRYESMIEELESKLARNWIQR